MPVPLLKFCPLAEALTADTDLLARFAAVRDEGAFTELVRRHGPAVYRVCRRLVPTHTDDAFQAVFLILACRFAAVRNPAAVGSWLVGVAGRVARQMRKAEHRRVGHERGVGRETARAESSPDAGELAAVLDDELARLPDTLRDPLLLCLVSGRTHAQAAADLGASVRTLRRRLDRARAVLRARLERRGVIPAVAIALMAGVGEATGAVPAALVRQAASVVFQFLDGGATATAAVVVAKGVMQGMVKLNVSVLVATAAAVLVCLGGAWSQDQPRYVDPPAGGTTQPQGEPKYSDPPAAGGQTRYVVPIAAPPAPQPGAPEPSARGPNFVAHAPTPLMARVIAAEAEHQRRARALMWLGKELPPWPKPCVIRYSAGMGGTSGASTFTFGTNKGEPSLASAEIVLRGDFMPVLTDPLPHEVTHTVLASFFARPVPRWADEGISLLAESEGEQGLLDGRAREVLTQGRGVRLKVLLPMTQYPKDFNVLYAQGHSLARFLVERTKGVPVRKDIPHVGELFRTGGEDGRRRLMAFVHLGMEGNTTESWGQAAKAVYGFDSVDALEEAWLGWLATPESVLAGKAGAPRPAPEAKPGTSDLIPPVKLPTAPFNRGIGSNR